MAQRGDEGRGSVYRTQAWLTSSEPHRISGAGFDGENMPTGIEVEVLIYGECQFNGGEKDDRAPGGPAWPSWNILNMIKLMHVTRA